MGGSGGTNGVAASDSGGPRERCGSPSMGATGSSRCRVTGKLAKCRSSGTSSREVCGVDTWRRRGTSRGTQVVATTAILTQGDKQGRPTHDLRDAAKDHAAMLRMTLGRVHAWAVPLGAVRVGDIRSRSLLFKVLGDQPEIGVPSDLGRLCRRRCILRGHSRCHVLAVSLCAQSAATICGSRQS